MRFKVFVFAIAVTILCRQLLSENNYTHKIKPAHNSHQISNAAAVIQKDSHEMSTPTPTHAAVIEEESHKLPVEKNSTIVESEDIEQISNAADAVVIQTDSHELSTPTQAALTQEDSQKLPLEKSSTIIASEDIGQISNPAAVVPIKDSLEVSTSTQATLIQEESHKLPIAKNSTISAPDEIKQISKAADAIIQKDSHEVSTPTQAAVSQEESHKLPIENNSTINSAIRASDDIETRPNPANISDPASSEAIPEKNDSHILKLPTPQREELRIDTNSTIASDIVKMWHEPDSKAICVELKEDARCPHPSFIGRLSGPGLAMLEWTERQFPDGTPADSGTLLCGGYGHNWLDEGSYFVEILILHCKDFGVNALRRTKDLDAWLKADHKLDCVEDVKHNTITSKGRSAIHIPTSIEGNDSYRLGRWIRKQGLPSRPLYKRYQPVECFQKKGMPDSMIPPHCHAITERDKDGLGLSEYEFQWNMNRTEGQLLERLRQRQRERNIPTICAIGDSHSTYMAGSSLPALNLTNFFRLVKSPWLDPDGIVKRIESHNCDVFFVQAGLWPASFLTGGRPFTFAKYHEKLKKHVQNILGYNPNATIYLPTIDPAPLMAKVNQCIDWRTPTMLYGNSYVNQMVVQELNNTNQVKYLDTNFIVSTHWDGHFDWQHLFDPVRNRKTVYMAAVMSGEIDLAGLSDSN